MIIVLVVLMSGAILAQALLDGSTVLRFVQTSAVLSGLVPYGLFFLIAVAYAVGAARLAGRGALVQLTNAVEAISRVDVVCTDKTGTLTTGRLTVAELAVPAGAGQDPDAARRLLGTLARSVAAPNATTAAVAADTTIPGERAAVRDEVAFRSALRWSGITLASGAGAPDRTETSLVLGAPATLRRVLTDPPDVLDDLDDKARAFADHGLRVLLLAGADRGLRDDEGRPSLPPLRAIALVALADELRDGVRTVLADLDAEHVAVKVISGDDPDTVAALARLAGLTGPAISGPELAALPPGERFDEAVEAHDRVRSHRARAEGTDRRLTTRARSPGGDGRRRRQRRPRAQARPARGGHALRQRGHPRRSRPRAARRLLRHPAAWSRTEGRRIVAGVGSSMFLFLARVTTQMLVILTVTLLGLGFPYTPTQVGLTLFTVGVPTFFLTLWARPAPPRTTCWYRWPASSSRSASSPPGSPPPSTPTSTRRSPGH